MALQKLIESYAKDWNDNTLPLEKIHLKENKQNILIENEEKKVLEGYIVPIWKLDQKNLNERIYTKKLGEKIVKEKPVTLMLADHPEDEGSVKNIIGVTKNPFIKNNILFAECYIVDDNFKKKLDKIIELEAGIGLSNSALGELNESNEVIVDTFQIERLADAVLQPSYSVFINNEASKVIKENIEKIEEVNNTKILIIESLNDIIKNLKNYNLEQKNFILSMDKFIKEALDIPEIEEKISKFKELHSWCNNDDFVQPIKYLIETKLNEFNIEFENLAMKGKKTDTLEKEVSELDQNLKEKESKVNELNN